MKALHLTDRVTVYNCDCMAYMSTLPDNAFELAIVDPDFGLNDLISNGGTWAAKYQKGDGHLGGKPSEHYWKELLRVSQNQIVWGGNYFTDHLPQSRCWIVWDKVALMDTLADVELAWTSFDSNAKMWRGQRVHQGRIHITQKPIALYRWLLKNYATCSQCDGTSEVPSNSIDCDVQTCPKCKGKQVRILDTHFGSLSSGIACHIDGFEYVGAELDPDYFQAACKRFREVTAQKRLFA